MKLHALGAGDGTTARLQRDLDGQARGFSEPKGLMTSLWRGQPEKTVDLKKHHGVMTITAMLHCNKNDLARLHGVV